MSRTKKVLLVGWDAADWKVIHSLMDHGLMPNIKGMVQRGVMANLATLSPVLSPMLWTSIATGKRPYKHGVLGFVEPTADGSAVQPVTNLSRKTKAIWNILSQNGKRCLVVGWWPSHPAEPINGAMVSNHYQRAPRTNDARWPMAAGTVHPPELAQELADLRLHPLELCEEHIRPFLPHAEKIDQTKDRRLDTCLRTIADCTTIHSCATHLLQHEPWDFAAVYYDAIDHFGHAFMKYHPPRQDFVSEEDFDIYKNVVAAGYVYHDLMLGRLLELAGDETTVILMSDHGFHPDHLRPKAIPVEPAGPAVEHRDFGIFVMCGPGIKQDELVHGANLLDITPTILTTFGLPVGQDMDGHSLLEAFQQPTPQETIPSWDDVSGDDGQHPPHRRLDATESRESLEQLVALGYVERPDENRDKAVSQAMRELNYNLALAYIDAGMHPKATSILADLYRDYPLEFRFGIRLALCLQAQEMTDDMARVVDNLNSRWRKAAQKSRERLREIAEIAKERRRQRQKSRQMQASVETGESPETTEEENGNASPPLFNEAEQGAIRKLRAIARGNERALDYLASSVAMAKEDYDSALKHLASARESESLTPGFHLQVGNVYLELKRYDEAEQCYRRVLGLDTQNPNAHVGLCRVHLQRGRNRKALDAATTALSLKYHFPQAHYFLGVAQHRLGHPHEAIKSLEQAVAQNPNFAEAHTYMAQIYAGSLDDEGRASEHRWTAGQIRQERKRLRERKSLPELPPLDDTVLDEDLPVLPKPTDSTLKPPLAAAPVQTDQQPPTAAGQPFVIVVSGLPRSGTSMMMQMLDAAGLTMLTDEERPADANNPRGYFELERVRRLQVENDWLDEARGKVIKVVAPLIPFLPQDCPYRVLFMERDLNEIIASQSRMLGRLKREGGKLDEQQFQRVLTRQIQHAKRILAGHQVPLLSVSYADALRQAPETARRVTEFLELDLDQAAMQRVVDPELYRERNE